MTYPTPGMPGKGPEDGAQQGAGYGAPQDPAYAPGQPGQGPPVYGAPGPAPHGAMAPYWQPPQGGGAAAVAGWPGMMQLPEHPKQTTIVVMLAIGWMVCPVFSIVSFFMARAARREIKAGLYRESQAIAIVYWVAIAHVAFVAVGAAVWVTIMATVFAPGWGSSSGPGFFSYGASNTHSLARQEEYRQLGTIATTAQQHRVGTGELPASLDLLILPFNRVDAWGNAYQYTYVRGEEDGEAMVVVVSYGGDAKRGGTGDAADIRVKVYEDGSWMISDDAKPDLLPNE